MSVAFTGPARSQVQRPQSPVRVLFVDDNVLATQALQRFMTGRSEVVLVGWTVDAEEAVSCVRTERAEVVLLDLEMPGVDTLGLIPRLEESQPGVRVVMFSGHSLSSDIERSLGAGAAGYICKDEPTAVIVDMLVRAAAGACVLSPLAERAFLGEH